MSEFLKILQNYDRGFLTLDEARHQVMREAERLMFRAINNSENDTDTLGFFKIMWFLIRDEDEFFHYVMHAYEEAKNAKVA